MAAVSLLAFWVLCHLVLAHSAEDGRTNKKECPPSFTCGKLGNLGFPFTSQACPCCDLLSLSNCDEETPTIQLEKGGRGYQVDNISQSDIVLINDPTLRKSLDAKSCQYFEDLALPNTPFLSFQVIHNLSMLKCNHSSLIPSQPDSLQVNCSDHGYSIYYNHQYNDSTTLPQHCSIIHLPANQTAPDNSSTDLFSLLSDRFSLQVHINGECGLCHHIGGECAQDSNGRFHCAKGNDKSGFKLGLILGLGIGLALIVAICLLLLYVRRRPNKQNFASLERTRISFSHPSPIADLEEGSVHNGVHIFSYSELEEATNHFKESNEIGDGRFGAAYYGKLQDGREVAVKRLYAPNYRRFEMFIAETEILTRLRHKNLVSLHGCTSGCSRELLLVYEYIPNGNLAYHLHGEGSKTGSSMTWPIRMSIAIETAGVLAYLHASDTIHGDVKTDNILLDNDFCVKVAGFELSRLFPVDVTHASTAPLGTPGYVDPEYLQCYQLTHKSDVYSFGVVLIELISSKPAFDIGRRRHELNLANLAANKVREGAFSELVDPSLGFDKDESTRTMMMSVAELAFQCLQLDKGMRPDMAEVTESLKMIQSPREFEVAQDDNKTSFFQLACCKQ